MKVWGLIGFALLMSLSGIGQSLTPEQLRFLNKEIRFLNESVHRMVIVFQVYENYNRTITKHVDLPSSVGLKNTSTHLAENVFADLSLVVRGDSPLSLYEDLNKSPLKSNMPVNNWSLIKEGKKIIDFLNKDRHKIDHIIDNEDLEVFSNIQTIYQEMEEALRQYDNFRSTVKMFEKLHQQMYHDVVLPKEEKQVYTALIELNYDIKKIIRQIRNDNQSGVINGVNKLVKEIGWLKACVAKLLSQDQRADLYSVVTSIEKLVDQIRGYIGGDAVPQEYMPFGKGYYYHNFELLPKINQYGSGYVGKLDEFFKKYDWKVINFLEEPHYIKIVYPERLPLDIMLGDDIASDQNIRDISPPELPKLDKIVVQKEDNFFSPVRDSDEEEEVIPSEPIMTIVHSEVIRVDSASFEIELFDHLRKDGDRVSISINGEWIHRKVSLEGKKRKIRLSILSGGSNHIIIRADNVGWRTPNTVGIIYKANKSENNTFLRRDLKTNEAIEIKFVRR